MANGKCRSIIVTKYLKDDARQTRHRWPQPQDESVVQLEDNRGSIINCLSHLCNVFCICNYSIAAERTHALIYLLIKSCIVQSEQWESLQLSWMFSQLTCKRRASGS